MAVLQQLTVADHFLRCSEAAYNLYEFHARVQTSVKVDPQHRQLILACTV